MPFFNSSRRTECITETIDTISMLETIIEQHPGHQVIIGGDFNSELKGNSPFDQYWDDFMSKNQFACCDSALPCDSFTYHHKGLDQKKWNDHFVVSSSLLNGKLRNFAILNNGDNISDHFPITMEIPINISQVVHHTQEQFCHESLKWDKLNSRLIDSYTSRLQGLVDALPQPEVAGWCSAFCLCLEH